MSEQRSRIPGPIRTETGRSRVLRLIRGCRLGKYRLEKRLGKGGYCEVWKARDRVEGISVALKIPLAGTDGGRDNQSVLKEVRLLAQLHHPHLMPVKNADIIDGYAVMATELSGGTLDDCRKPMGVKRITSLIAQVLDGLSYAHDRHVVHCDVTPGNIFLFDRHYAALGDFGIGLQRKGRMFTINEFGTPGYVAPEQAYGYPTYASDCFAVGIILYEYLTGYLPRWPFRWPMRGHKRLRQRAGSAMVRFLEQSLAVAPENRFSHAREMFEALVDCSGATLPDKTIVRVRRKEPTDWRKARRDTFIKRYKKPLVALQPCQHCGEPIAEPMRWCPWCGSNENRFDDRTRLSYVCPRCHRGVLPEWRFCPWCYGPDIQPEGEHERSRWRADGHCRECGGKLMRFMRYCPWCRAKVKQPWQYEPFPELCTRCGGVVDSNFWSFCPWCRQLLLE